MSWAKSLREGATLDEDYEISAESVTLEIGQLFSETITITPIDDAIFEPNDELTLILRVDGAPPSRSIYLPARRLTITLEDNDPEVPADTLAFYGFDRTRHESFLKRSQGR